MCMDVCVEGRGVRARLRVCVCMRLYSTVLVIKG